MIESKIPTAADIKEALDKLEAHPGSVVLIAIEQPEVCNFTRTRRAWLSREERKALKAALERARKKRAHLRQEASIPPRPLTAYPTIKTAATKSRVSKNGMPALPERRDQASRSPERGNAVPVAL